MRQCNPFFAQRKDKSDKDYVLDMFSFLKKHRSFMARVRYIAKYINEAINKTSLTPLDKIQFTLDFVQEPNIRFVSNKDCKSVNNYEDYIRYPDETLYDKEGDCNCKSLLAAMLFHVMGFNVMYLASRKYKHSAIGIEISEKDKDLYGKKIDKMLVREDGKCYIYCETTGDRFRVGKTIDGMSVGDFEEKMLLNTESNLPTDMATSEKSVIYNWNLTSFGDSQLRGTLDLKFNNEDIDTLRSRNPFRTYGHDTNTYDVNVRTMFDYLGDGEEGVRYRNVLAVARYIKRKIEMANLSELDMVQFVLNFVQAPNIPYQIDEDCSSIGFQKEYMRFPDETLYDKEGDCDCKSFLAASILHCLDYNVLFLLSNKLKHAALAVECKEEWFDLIGRDNIENIKFEHNGRNYVYCESTGEGNRVGFIKEGDSIKDFETIVELPAKTTEW